MPKYRQLANWLRARIQAGELTGRLPSQNALAAQHQVAVETVRRALEVLRGEGLIRTFAGSGSEAVPPGER